jgi:hypothetical protein
MIAAGFFAVRSRAIQDISMENELRTSVRRVGIAFAIALLLCALTACKRKAQEIGQEEPNADNSPTRTRTTEISPKLPSNDPLEPFIAAVERHDLRSILKDSETFTREFSQASARIHSENPQVLWAKLDEEVLNSQEQTLINHTPSAANVDELIGLLSFPHTHTLLERRAEKLVNPDGSLRDVLSNFLAVKYSNWEAPFVKGGLLKETIINIAMDGKTGLYIESRRVDKGDVYAAAPPLHIYAVSVRTEPQRKLALW